MNILFFLTPKEDVAYLYGDNTLRQALEKMEHHRYTAIPIIDRKNGHYIGTITEGDFLWYTKKCYSLTLKDAEDIPLLSVPRNRDNEPVCAGADMEDLIHYITRQNFVPVIDDQKCFIGIITRKDVISYLADHQKGAKVQHKGGINGN